MWLLTLEKCISFSLLISRIWISTARRSNPIISALIRQYVYACILGHPVDGRAIVVHSTTPSRSVASFSQFSAVFGQRYVLHVSAYTMLTLSLVQLSGLQGKVSHRLPQHLQWTLIFEHSVMIIMCSISCNYLMIGLRRVDGSLVGGVTTEIVETWQARVRGTMDVTTTFANEAMAHTRETDSSPWDVEMSPRSARSRSARRSIDEG